MKFTPASPAAGTDGLLATDVALAQIGETLNLVDHRARARLRAEKRVELVQTVAELGRRLEALKVVLVGEAEQHQAAQIAHGTSLRSVLSSTAQVTPGEAASWGHAAKSLANRDQVQSAALAGEVSIPQARAIGTVLTELPTSLSENQRERAEQLLINKAKTLDARTLADQGRNVLEEIAPEVDAVADEMDRLDAQRRRAHAARSFSMVADGRGSILLRGQLPVLEATPLQQLVAAYVESDRRARLREADKLDALAESRSPDQRRADALIAIANSQVSGLQSAGFLPGPAAGQPTKPDSRNLPESPAGKNGNLTQPTARHLSKQAAGRLTGASAESKTQPTARHLTGFSAGNIPKPTVGNLPEPRVGNLPEPTDGGPQIQANANPPGMANANLPGLATGNLPKQAGGELHVKTNANLPGLATGNLPKQAGGELHVQTNANLPGLATENLPESTTDPLLELTSEQPPIPVAQDPPEGAELGRQVNPASTTRMGRVPLVAGDRPRVSVMMSYQQLLDQAEQAGLLVDGSKITAGELRRLMCDAELVPVVLGSNSEVLDVGRAQRLVTPSIRRALSLRDGGCAFPGCNTPDPACEAHHIVPWWSGGSTSLSNLVLLCPHHHGTVEPSRFFNSAGSPKWRVQIADDGYPEFQPPSRNGTKPQPMRHQRTLHRAERHAHNPRTDNPRTRNSRRNTSETEPTHTREGRVP